jgi:hypothetical protein
MFDLPGLEPLNISAGFFDEKDEENLPMIIKGQPADSKEEARAALALEYWGIDFIFHYQFNGGTQVRGGQVIDLIAKTVPLWTPIYINGEYWHGSTKKYEDTIKQREFTRATRGSFLPPKIIWDYELTSIEHARATIKDKVL